jgi:hypothetical protein
VRTLALVNESTLVGPDDVARCAEALQTQVSRDFAATWGIDARLRVTAEPAEDDEPLYLLDDAARAEALGLSRRGTGGRPFGVALVRPCLEAGEAWQVAVSHALLEMLADPLVNLSALGPSPLPLSPEGRGGGKESKPALFALEVCDPVAGDEYEVAGVPVANFVLPTWFTPGPLPDALLVDFLGRLTDPFTLSPGGHGSYCTELGRWQAWYAKRCPRHRRQPGAYSRRRRRGVAVAARFEV